jgi:uncharacterized protein (DUF362 family)/NAD-dependent dihydropyrimidine dehydrogenase PreA subunit
MNNKVVVRECKEYEIEKIYDLISEIYKKCKGPELQGRKVLVKPNILNDADPGKCISTHPVFVEAVIMYLHARNAKVFVGDSPAVHLKGFRGEKSGIFDVCRRTGAEWVDFAEKQGEIRLRNGKIRIASVVDEVDLIISLPKFKNHELVYFTGAIKNTLGLVPGFSKAKQHAIYQNRENFSGFLVDLCEAVLPQFFLMDGIRGMEGPGPGQGIPVNTEVIIGSSNPLALDIIASTIAGYNPQLVPTNRIALARRKWLTASEDITYDGPELEGLIRHDFKRIPYSGRNNISLKFITNRIKPLRKFERRPVFNHRNCTGCLKCIRICPVQAIEMHKQVRNHVVLTDSKCIRCFCCSEVCPEKAVDVRRKIFGV